MSPQQNQWDGQGLDRCQHGDPLALAELREKMQSPILSILLSRGASRTEAEDVLADLWADCVPGAQDKPSLLEKFAGKSTLQGWLATIATNRWIDFKRRGAKRVELASGSSEAGHDAFDKLPAAASGAKEETLTTLLRDCLQAAFNACSAEAMVLLRLVYLHELTQREIVRMLGWSESKVSRFMAKAMEEIEQHTLSELKKRDPWLELSWQDFVDLCETHQVGLM
jgi:RNA polymerase sigma factor (sigma-70 family)